MGNREGIILGSQLKAEKNLGIGDSLIILETKVGLRYASEFSETVDKRTICFVVFFPDTMDTVPDKINCTKIKCEELACKYMILSSFFLTLNTSQNFPPNFVLLNDNY